MKSSRYIFAFLSFFFVFSTTSFSQENINNYKYIVIPTRYDFSKSANQYEINSLTKFLFNKYGFTAFMENEEFPDDLRSNRCLALYVDVIELKGFLKTRLQIDLKDCNSKLIQSSKVGETREKEYAKAYNLALRDAFETFQFINYEYQPSQEIVAQSTLKIKVASSEEKAEIERLKKELETLKEKQKPTEVVSEKTITPIESKNSDSNVQISKEEISTTLYAQPIDNGFQLVDNTPKKVMVLFYSGITDTFIVKDRNAIVYKKGDKWVLAENDGINLRSEILNVKF